MNPPPRFSVGQNIEKLYKDIFDEISPIIKKQQKGVLSTVIYIILEPDESQAEKICNSFNIKPNVLLEDDLSISLDIIGFFISNPNNKRQWINDKLIKPGKDILKNARKIGSNWEDNDMKLFQIVLIGCLIVGVVSCAIYLNKKQEEEEKKNNQNIPSDNSPPQPKVPVPVGLCLVVPASAVGNIRKNHTINVSDIETLIENASYFLCASPEDANTIQQRLKLTNEDITDVSEQREIYVRIDIADGPEMIGKKVQYILKRNLPPNGQGTVKELACLEYLSVSGLENFNRV